MQSELLKEDFDLEKLHHLWQQSFNIRRLCVRELTVPELLERFPGYRISELVSVISNVLISVFLRRNLEIDG